MLFVWILLAALLILVLLLAVPVELWFYMRLQAGRRDGGGRVKWLFGLVRVRFPGKAQAKAKAQPEKPKPSRRSKQSRFSPLAALSIKGFVGRGLTLARRLLGAIHIHHLDVDARLGLGDPADTGRLWAIIGPMSALLAMPGTARIDVQPDFSDEVLSLTGDGRIRLVPLQLLFLVVVFMLSPTTLREFRAMRS